MRGLLQGNSYLRQTSGYQRTNMGGRSALATTLSGRSPITGQNEVVTVVTTQLRDGNIFYLAAVAPDTDYRSYQSTFNNVLRSIQLND